MTRGAGGWSISPFSCYNVVPATAPAFTLLQHLLPNIDLDSPTCATKTEDGLDICTKALVRLYSEGKASPYDVNQYGNTILHVCLLSIRRLMSLTKTKEACRLFGLLLWGDRMDVEIAESLFRFLRSLHDLNVPREKANFDG